MKKPYSVGYFSSYDRGLECLLDMWPEIKKQIPEAKLNIYYGWDMYDQFHSKDQEKMKWKWQIIRKINELDDVTEHGRVNHQELADAMKDIQVWAYPTEFTEIYCITALKAQVANCSPVVTKVGALDEVVTVGQKIDCQDIYTNKKGQAEFINQVCIALRNWHHQDGSVIKRGKRASSRLPQNRYWPEVAAQWDKELS